MNGELAVFIILGIPAVTILFMIYKYLQRGWQTFRNGGVRHYTERYTKDKINFPY